MIEQQLFSHLSTFPGLAALAGNRVYPLALPQGATLPAVVYLRVSENPVIDRDNREAKYSQDRFQIDGWAATFDGAVALRGQVRAAMGAFRVAATPRVDGAWPVAGNDVPEVEADRYRFRLDYRIGHEVGT